MNTINSHSPVSTSSKIILTPETEAEHKEEYKLVKKAAAGDVKAFEQLYWKHHRRVFCVCLRMTKNEADAEDLTQQVFLQLFRKIDSFRGDSAFSTWLHRLTVNLVLMHFRSNKSRKENTTEDGELPENNFADGRKSENVNEIVRRYELNQLISQLPEGYRKVVIMHDIQGLEHNEIAELLGCAAGTSKSQLHKARLKLRKLLTTNTDTAFEL